MTKVCVCTLGCFLMLSIKANSQITKGNWMVGGNASFSSANYISPPTGNNDYTNTIIQISPNVGYFIGR